MAWDVLSSSVRRTVALLVSPAVIAASRDLLTERRRERRWIIGQRSVERPRSVSTAFRGELDNGSVDTGGVGKGVEEDCAFEFGAVPSDRAAITS